MIEETPSPARAGRLLSSACSSAVGSASTQSWPELKRPGKSRSRKNVLVSTWSRGTGSSSGMSSDDEDVAQRQHAGRAVSPPGPGGAMMASRVSNSTVPPCFM